ncbi:MAG: CotH kinase family protein [Ignavibacteriales bacterium]|nr:CotH kinase family protein [Ignavibacteriales bacterium]
MKTKFLMPLFLFLFFSMISLSQNDESWKVYDDSEVAEIRITMNPGDLQYLYDYPEKENDSMMVSSINFKNALIDETIDSVGIRIRGNTSRESAKKSFKLSFNTFIKGRKFYSLEKMNLNGEHNDPSIIRSKLCWDFFNNIGIVSSRASHAAVYINGDYYGLYISVEHIDENFIKKNFKDDSGNLWKCLYGANLTPLNNNNISAYTLETNTGANDFSELDTLTKIINNTTLSNFENSIDKYFNVMEYLKIQAVDIITGSWDDYSVLSNNFYLYHDPSTDRFHWVPYDYDNTFGIDWLGFDWANENPYTFGKLLNQPRPLINRLLEIPRYKNMLSHFMEFYLETYMQAEKFNGHVDSIKTIIEAFALVDDYKSYDWGFTNEDFQNSFDAENFTIDPHVKYSIKEYNLLRKNSLNSQIDYVDSEPIIYNISLSNTKPAYDESIKVNASVFSVNPIQLAYAELEYKDGSKSNIPLTYTPVNNTNKVELNDNWETEIPVLGKNQNVKIRIYVEDNLGTNAFYPADGISIKTAGEITKEVVFSELMSSNVSTIQDNVGEYDDWLEIYNPQDTTVNLSGKFLTDKIDKLIKWQIPANVKIEPKEQILIWCDEDQDQ